MCNAWNHPPNCLCGWGGEGHLGKNKAQHVPKLKPRSYSSVISYVRPNACCPVCHASVFFYQSPDGGRVFFDALGPPWPKHPCTDTASSPNRALVTAQLSSPVQQHYAYGLTSAWRPLIIESIYKSRPPRIHWIIRGTLDERIVTLHAAAESISGSALIFGRVVSPGEYMLSVMSIAPRSQSVIVSTVAGFTNPNDPKLAAHGEKVRRQGKMGLNERLENLIAEINKKPPHTPRTAHGLKTSADDETMVLAHRNHRDLKQKGGRTVAVETIKRKLVRLQYS